MNGRAAGSSAVMARLCDLRGLLSRSTKPGRFRSCFQKRVAVERPQQLPKGSSWAGVRLPVREGFMLRGEAALSCTERCCCPRSEDGDLSTDGAEGVPADCREWDQIVFRGPSNPHHPTVLWLLSSSSPTRTPRSCCPELRAGRRKSEEPALITQPYNNPSHR